MLFHRVTACLQKSLQAWKWGKLLYRIRQLTTITTKKQQQLHSGFSRPFVRRCCTVHRWFLSFFKKNHFQHVHVAKLSRFHSSLGAPVSINRQLIQTQADGVFCPSGPHIPGRVTGDWKWMRRRIRSSDAAEIHSAPPAWLWDCGAEQLTGATGLRLYSSASGFYTWPEFAKIREQSPEIRPFLILIENIL